MKALVLAPQPFFSPRGTPFSVYYRAKAMAELGEKLDLLTYGQGSDVKLDSMRIFRTPSLRALGKIRTGPSVLKLVHDTFLFLYAFGLLARHRYDYVHAHEEGVFIARILQPIFRFKLLYDMHSSLPEQLANFAYSKSRLISALFRWAERDALRKSQAIIVVCPALMDYAKTVTLDDRKIVLIENSLIDDIEVAGGPGSGAQHEAIVAARKLAEAGAPLIVYTGTLEPYQGIRLLLESFALVVAEHDSARLLIVGGDPAQVARYRSVAAELGLAERVLFSGTVAPDVARSCERLATMLVSPRLTGTNTPMKVYAQLASGVPILATRIESHTQVFDDDVATLVDPERESLARGMSAILDDPEAAKRKAGNALKVFNDKYSRAVYIDGTKRILELLR